MIKLDPESREWITMEEIYEPKWWQKAIWRVRAKLTWRNKKAELRDLVAKRDRTINMVNAIVDQQTEHLRTLLAEVEAYEAELALTKEKLNHAEELTETLLDEAIDYDLEVGDLLNTLKMIAGEAKPTSNATVKRMAAMAQAELDARKDDDDGV